MGHDDVVARLLDAKPELVDEKVDFQVSALTLAAQSGHQKVVERLLATSQGLIDRDGVLPCLSLLGPDIFFIFYYHCHFMILFFFQ